MSSKKKAQKNKAKIYILIGLDHKAPLMEPEVMYKIRVLSDSRELNKPLTSIPSFAMAMETALKIKKDIEKTNNVKISNRCILVLEGVEKLIDKAESLRRYIQSRNIVPCNKNIRMIQD